MQNVVPFTSANELIGQWINIESMPNTAEKLLEAAKWRDKVKRFSKVLEAKKTDGERKEINGTKKVAAFKAPHQIT